jgi:hypothetical protein
MHDYSGLEKIEQSSSESNQSEVALQSDMFDSKDDGKESLRVTNPNLKLDIDLGSEKDA